MIVHEKSKSFNCDVCLKVFSRKLTIINLMHYRMHSGEKPFACQICDRKFAVTFSLIQDKATNSEIKSFKCSICPEGRFFKTKHEFNNHMIYHYEPKFSCSHCDYKTHTKCNLNRHENTHIQK